MYIYTHCIPTQTSSGHPPSPLLPPSPPSPPKFEVMFFCRVKWRDTITKASRKWAL